MYQTKQEISNSNPRISQNKFWFACYTKPRHEFKAAQYLNSIEIEYYLPTVTTMKQWSDRKKKVTEPLLKGYVFLFCSEVERFEALQFDSIISTISFNGKPARIPEWQIDNLKKMLDESREVFVKDMLSEGTPVKIIEGPFSGVTGVVTHSNEHGRMLGITIDLVNRTVLVKLPKESIVKETQK